MTDGSDLKVPLGAACWLGLKDATLVTQHQSDQQCIQIWRHPLYGHVYLLDGDLMASTSDEYIGHESLVHTAACACVNPENALILGGGDGASARELLKHPSIRSITVAELDPEVISMSRRHLPSMAHDAFLDPRVRAVIGDASLTLERQECASQHLILFDLTAIGGAAASLHDLPFLNRCHDKLHPDGFVVIQLGSPFYHADLVQTVYERAKFVFPLVCAYAAAIPAYGGTWTYAIASKGADPRKCSTEEIEARLVERHIRNLDYYNAAIHQAQFMLSNDLRRLFA